MAGELAKSEEGVEGGKVDSPRYRPARGYCSFVPSVTPARVPPGGTGTLIVTMLLEGDAVMTVPPPVRFKIPSEQGPFQVGNASFRPPKPGYLTEAFRGQAVYDNYAIFEVPFTVRRDSPLGKFRLGGEMEFELNNGRTGQPIETFLERVGVSVEIGDAPAEAVPVIQPGTTDDALAGVPPGGTARPTAAQTEDGDRTGDRAQERDIGSELIAAEKPAELPAERPTEAMGDLSAPAAGNLPWLLGGLAALLLLIGLVLLRRL